MTTTENLRHFPAPGCWPWDHWQRLALKRGLASDLAALGRSLMREADQHGWCGRLRAECGWNDAGRAMLARLLAHPRRTAARLEWLYATDGLRFDPWERNEYYEDSPCWKAMRQKWNREQAAPITSNQQPLTKSPWPASPTAKSTASKPRPTWSP